MDTFSSIFFKFIINSFCDSLEIVIANWCLLKLICENRVDDGQ